MANTRRPSGRRSQRRDYESRFVEPVLDKSWQSPYVPSPSERDANARALARFVWRRQRPRLIAAALLFVVSLALVSVAWFVPVIVALVVGAYVASVARSIGRLERRATSLASKFIDVFSPAGTSVDRQRLITVVDRLGATFGLDAVSCFIIDDTSYNAALLSNQSSYALFVTGALIRDFDLIELEGVVAHCMARQRLGALTRLSVASLGVFSSSQAEQLAGPGVCYRADEVAAAAIRYPLGLAEALARCERQRPEANSFFASTQYASSRWVWFNQHADRATSDLGDLDDVGLRSLALAEW